MDRLAPTTSYLPVPYFYENFIENTNRQPSTSKKRPPKLQHKPKLNVSECSLLHRSIHNNSISSAQAISFKNEDESIGCDASALLCSIYDRNCNQSYFEQCFDIVGKIGEGSFGEVFKVRNKVDGLLYAVKKSKKLYRSISYRQERLEEVKRYEQFSDHEHCVKFYSAWEEDDQLYMQMELCRENLENYLSRKIEINETEIWSILLDILLALKSLHDKNLIHLDIKLDNILIGEDGSYKLGDFGLVVDVDQANTHEVTEGDGRYAAPEVMSGYYSKAADVFSLGITILELSSNLQLPLNGLLWQKLRNGCLPQRFISKVSPELQTVIRLMMHPDPNRRPTVDELLSHKKLVTIQKKRQHWSLLRRFRKSYQQASRFIIAKMCNFKITLRHLLITFVAALRFCKNENTNTVNCKENYDSSDEDIDKLLNYNYDENSNKSMKCHSTPLNHHSISLRKTKKKEFLQNFDDINSNEFDDFNRNIDLENSIQHSSIICKQLFVDDSD